MKRKIPVKMVECKIGFGRLLTKGKKYEIIKNGFNFYVIKRDDGSIDRMDKTRFEAPIEM